MTKRSMTNLRKKFDDAYLKGWNESFARTVMDAQTTGIKLRDGSGLGKLVIFRGREAIAADFGIVVPDPKCKRCDLIAESGESYCSACLDDIEATV
jgi:hypothetical protein